MNVDKPKRFRFSLRFLLAWVLLTAGLLWGTSTHFAHDSQVVTYLGKSTTYLRVDIVQGWPFTVYLHHYGHGDPGYYAPEPPEKIFELYPPAQSTLRLGGLAGNLALCLIVSFVTCAAIGYVFKKKLNHRGAEDTEKN